MVSKGKRPAMTRTPLLLALAATAALAGCNKEDHTIVAGPAGDNTTDMNLANVQLPPSISSSKLYRCKDNSVIHVDWLSDGSARVRPEGAAVGTPVEVGAGKAIQGTPEGSSITYNGKACNA
jgi:hypothetical protein